MVLSQSGMSKAIIKKQLPSNDPTTGDYSEAGSTQLRILRVRVFVIVHKWRRATGMGPGSYMYQFRATVQQALGDSHFSLFLRFRGQSTSQFIIRNGILTFSSYLVCLRKGRTPQHKESITTIRYSSCGLMDSDV